MLSIQRTHYINIHVVIMSAIRLCDTAPVNVTFCNRNSFRQDFKLVPEWPVIANHEPRFGITVLD